MMQGMSALHSIVQEAARKIVTERCRYQVHEHQPAVACNETVERVEMLIYYTWRRKRMVIN